MLRALLPTAVLPRRRSVLFSVMVILSIYAHLSKDERPSAGPAEFLQHTWSAPPFYPAAQLRTLYFVNTARIDDLATIESFLDEPAFRTPSSPAEL